MGGRGRDRVDPCVYVRPVAVTIVSIYNAKDLPQSAEAHFGVTLFHLIVLVLWSTELEQRAPRHRLVDLPNARCRAIEMSII